MRTYRIDEWMSSPPIVILPTTTLAAAQHLMERCHVRRLPIVEGRRLIGIVTWGDLRAAWPSAATTLSVHEWREMLEHATVAEYMSRDPVTVASDAAAPCSAGNRSQRSAKTTHAGTATITSIAVRIVATSIALAACSGALIATRRFLASSVRPLPIGWRDPFARDTTSRHCSRHRGPHC